jgi:hypothetical protein
MSLEYFEIAGVLFAAYCVIRFVIWTELRRDIRPDPPSRPFEGAINAIDTTVLSDRLQHVRRDYHVEKPAQSDSFKRSQLVKSRQEKIARLAFFQKPPPEPPEHERGWNALLI